MTPARSQPVRRDGNARQLGTISGGWSWTDGRVGVLGGGDEAPFGFLHRCVDRWLGWADLFVRTLKQNGRNEALMVSCWMVSGTAQNRIAQNRTDQNRTACDRTAQNRAGQRWHLPV